MTITEFQKLVAKAEGKKKELSIAQIAEVLKVADKMTGGAVYKVIRALPVLLLALAMMAHAAEYRYTAKPGDTVVITVEATPPVVPVEPTPPTVPMAVPSLGANLEEPTDWERSFFFRNAIKSARVIDGNPATGRSVWRVLSPTDHLFDKGNAHGSLPADPKRIAGTYSLTYTGGGTATATGATLVNGKLTVTGTSNVDLSFSAPVSNLALWRPGYSSGTFTNEFLSDIAPFSTLRFMNWQRTNTPSPDENGNIARETLERWAALGGDRRFDWKDRPLPSDATWSGPLGVPFEVIIELCNTAKKNPWIQIPHDAGPDFVPELAKLFKAKLDTTLSVYVGISNEPWNGIFQQSKDIVATAKAYTGTPALTPYAPGSANEWYAARHYTMKLLIDASNAFRAVYGDAGMMTTVRPVFEDQVDTIGPTASALYWGQWTYPKPLNWYVYGVAIGPYYGPSDKSTKDAALASIDATLTRRDTWEWDKAALFASMARAYKLRLLGYEGGIDSNDWKEPLKDIDVRIALAYEPRMQAVTSRYLAQNFRDGMDLLCYFWLCSTNSASGSWGLKDNSVGATPKYDAAKAFATTPVPSNAGRGMLWKFYQGNGTLGDTRIQEPWFHYHNWWTGGPWPRKEKLPTEAWDFTATGTASFFPMASGAYTLACDIDANDTASVTPATFTATAGVPVPIIVKYSANFGGDGVARFRLWQETGGKKTIVPQWQLTP